MMAPGRLADLLAELPVHVESAAVEVGLRRVDGYGGEPRPTGTLTVRGAGEAGHGESVAWTPADQRRFAGRVPELLPPGRRRVGDPVDAEPYTRAAIEGALLDLALRQAGLHLADVAGAPARVPLRYAISFDACPDPAARAEAITRDNPGARFKIDVLPAWSDDAIARLEGIDAAVLDFKEQGGARLVEALRAVLPLAILEDPPVADGPVARDRTVLSAADVEGVSGTHVNLKAPRMGGFLEALRGAARARARGLSIYWGGMFELGPARWQARQLAAVVCPDADNDLAPISRHETDHRGPCPLPVRLDLPGFGRIGS